MFWDGHIKEWNELPRANQGYNQLEAVAKRDAVAMDVVNKVKATILRTNKIRTRCRESSFKLMALAPIILMDIITGVNVI